MKFFFLLMLILYIEFGKKKSNKKENNIKILIIRFFNSRHINTILKYLFQIFFRYDLPLYYWTLYIRITFTNRLILLFKSTNLLVAPEAALHPEKMTVLCGLHADGVVDFITFKIWPQSMVLVVYLFTNLHAIVPQ